ncbi:hypothetical protein GCM10010254_14380 [Streptomyces chromofuscus]|nr:hypothetical protein GCM10010254_14380 [Streptomyces chromofuscus]
MPVRRQGGPACTSRVGWAGLVGSFRMRGGEVFGGCRGRVGVTGRGLSRVDWARLIGTFAGGRTAALVAGGPA